MRNFSLRTRENSLRSSKVRLWKPVFFVLGAFFLLIFVRDGINIVASAVASPFFFVRHYIETSSDTVPAFLRSQNELISQIRSLEAEIESEKGREVYYGVIKEENDELRGLFHGSSTTPEILSGVIARPPFTPYDTLILDRGKDAGIVEGAPVYYGKGLALGYIHTVSSQTSVVRIFSSPGTHTTVYIFGPDIFTEAYGEGGGVIRVSVPQGIQVKQGDIVVLPSLEARILGTVGHIRSEPTEPEQYAYVTLDVPLQSIRLVSVGTRTISPKTFSEAEMIVEDVRKELFTVPIPENYHASTTREALLESPGTTTP